MRPSVDTAYVALSTFLSKGSYVAIENTLQKGGKRKWDR
jgi:hypothetical protein